MSVSCSLEFTLEKGKPLESLTCDVFLCFCHFSIRCHGPGLELDCIVPDLCLLPQFDIREQVSHACM